MKKNIKLEKGVSFALIGLFIIGTILFPINKQADKQIVPSQIYLSEAVYNFSYSEYSSKEEWNRTFGGSDCEWGNRVLQTTDGGFIIVAYTYRPRNVWLIKTDSNGYEEWNQKFGGPDHDCCFNVLETDDGGYILCGYTWSYGAGKVDVWLIKTDENGNEQWNKTYGGSGSDAGYNIEHTNDGCYVITGRSRGSLLLLKVDSKGNALWNQSFGYSNLSEWGYAVEPTSDGGYIITGEREVVQHYRQTDLWLIKTDEYGNMEWNKTYGGDGWDYGNDVLQTDDGGYIVVGGLVDWDVCAWMFKTNSNGTILWQKQYYGKTKHCFAKSVDKTGDGGYILLTNLFIMSDESPEQIWLLKTDNYGNKLWGLKFGGKGYGEYEGGMMVKQTAVGGYIIVGWTSTYGAGCRDIWLIKIKPSPILNGTKGENGWFQSPVNTTFYYNPSIVAEIHYAIDGVWYDYDGPFVISKLGKVILDWYWVDHRGNKSIIYSTEIYIDYISPIGELSYEIRDLDLVFIASCEDNTSGIDKVEFLRNEKLEYIDYKAPFEWISDCSKIRPISARIYDRAGNIIEDDINCTPKFYHVIGLIFHPEFSKNVLRFKSILVFYKMTVGTPDGPVEERRVFSFCDLSFILNQYSGFVGRLFIRATFNNGQ